MALNDNIKVKMPTKGIAFKKGNKKGTKYVYHTVRSYRNEKGKPTNDRVSIGKFDEETGLLIPNNNYYKYYSNDSVKVDQKQNLNFGATFLFENIFNELGLSDILSEAFGMKLASQIKTIAKYFLTDGSALFYIDEFCESTHIQNQNFVSSKTSSVVFEKIKDSSMMEFYKLWAKKIEKNDYIAYDVTSISSYSENQSDIEYGYNRDNESLPQINLGLYFGTKTKLPVFYTKYAGSIVDKSYLKYMMKHNKALGIKNVNFVMDNGFYSKDNISYMKEKDLPFLMCVSNSLITSKKLIDENLETIDSYANYISSKKVYGIKKQTHTYGTKANTFLYFDETNARMRKNSLYNRVEKFEFELNQLKELTPRQKKIYSKYFDISENKDNTFEFEINFEKVDKIAKMQGHFILVSSFKETDPAEILDIYRKKDAVEKMFDLLKNDLEMKRLQTHKSETTNGKLFISFIALIIRSHIQNRLQDYFKTNNSSVEKVIRQLSNIRTTVVSDKVVSISPLTAKQKKILSYFEINEEILLEKIDKLNDSY